MSMIADGLNPEAAKREYDISGSRPNATSTTFALRRGGRSEKAASNMLLKALNLNST